MSLTKEKVLNVLTKYWKLIEFFIDDKIDIAKREVALGEIGTVVGSTSETNGRVGLVPAPESGDEANKYLKANGTWSIPYDTATSTTSGLTKLYTDIGLNTDGTITQSALTTLLNDKQAAGNYALSDHGNHVPTIEIADNAKFLRNDNTWQTITPTNIGAANSVHTHEYLPLSGGIMNTGAQITKTALSLSWQQGRDYAVVAIKDVNGYDALTSIKTTNGSWEMGAYNSSGWADNLLFTYIKDTTYNGTNNADAQIRFTEQGGLVLQGHATLTYNSTTGCLEITVS